MADKPKCILVGLEASEGFTSTPALDYAVALAAHHGSCLTVCALPPSIYLPISRTGGGLASIVKKELDALEATTRETAKAAARLAAGAGVECVTEQSLSRLEPRSARLARLARVNDLCVLDAPGEGSDMKSDVVEDVLFDSGRPALLVPQAGGNPAPRRVAVAWDGSARAARAVDDALSFLQEAEQVFIVSVTGEKDLSRMAPGADLAAYLVRHGVNDPQIETLTAIDGDVTARLNAFLSAEQVELMVMGAFVHSRFREAVLGGVTRTMLQSAPAPLLLAH
ncbi:universal stress protein [Nitratireductor aquimarinus]|uniref:Universal stress protein n=1 Tax=Nitratireductor aquimarinus TaxID=889300 RepID=A0ABU4APN2_9HYPH|nr:universal stress protein [Nitratireductor aquimarinus]MDV6228184.1 universal stress protein [Nitratireductor aquimarinus]